METDQKNYDPKNTPNDPPRRIVYSAQNRVTGTYPWSQSANPQTHWGTLVMREAVKLEKETFRATQARNATANAVKLRSGRR